MRGEHPSPGVGEGDVWGSSPHARGAPYAIEIGKVITGVIPACAGSTRPIGRAAVGERGHPRMRGEHWVMWLAM